MSVWPRKKVSEIAVHSLGKMLDKSKNRGDMKPYLRNKNVRWFEFDLSDVAEMRFLPSEIDRYTVAKGDVVVCEGGYPGRAAIWDDEEPIFFQKALHRVRFHEPERNRWFLYYLLSCDLDGTLKKHFNGTGIQHFTGEALAQFELPIPPLEEQKRIVGILDAAFEGMATAKASAEANILNARALFDSQVNEILMRRGKNWSDRTLGASCSIARGGSPRPIKQYITTAEDGVNWIKIGDATASGKYIFATQEKIKPEGAKRSRVVRDGDFLLSNSMSFGRPYIMKTTGCIHDGWLVLADYQSTFDQDFLYHVLGSQFMYRQFDQLAAGSTVRNLNIELASRVVIPVPPLYAQREIGTRLDALADEVESLVAVYERKVAALDELKKALLHRAFSGHL